MEIDLNNFKFSFPLQMRWSDMDPLGHANNAIYVTYFEIGRGRYMVEACPDWNWTKDMFLIANVNVNFITELKLTSKDTRVHIKTGKIGTKSFVLEYVISSENEDERIIHATGSTTQIMFDMMSRKTIEVQNWVRESLSSFDGLTS